jgi:hypothetical protein
MQRGVAQLTRGYLASFASPLSTAVRWEHSVRVTVRAQRHLAANGVAFGKLWGEALTPISFAEQRIFRQAASVTADHVSTSSPYSVIYLLSKTAAIAYRCATCTRPLGHSFAKKWSTLVVRTLVRSTTKGVRIHTQPSLSTACSIQKSCLLPLAQIHTYTFFPIHLIVYFHGMVGWLE